MLIYVQLAERDVEIVADRGIDERVSAEGVGGGVHDDRASVCAGRWRDGALEGVAAVTQLLARVFPSAAQTPTSNQSARHFVTDSVVRTNCSCVTSSQ